MKKMELVAAVADKTEFSKKDAAKAVDAVFAAVKDALVAGEDLTIVGFGSFKVKERAAHQGVNPATGKKITIPASKNAAFKASSALKEELNK